MGLFCGEFEALLAIETDVEPLDVEGRLVVLKTLFDSALEIREPKRSLCSLIRTKNKNDLIYSSS